MSIELVRIQEAWDEDGKLLAYLHLLPVYLLSEAWRAIYSCDGNLESESSRLNSSRVVTKVLFTQQQLEVVNSFVSTFRPQVQF